MKPIYRVLCAGFPNQRDGKFNWEMSIQSAALDRVQTLYPLGWGNICPQDFRVCEFFEKAKAGGVVFVLNFLGEKEVSATHIMYLAWAWDKGILIVCIMEEKGNPYDQPNIRDAITYRVASVTEAADLISKLVGESHGQN